MAEPWTPIPSVEVPTDREIGTSADEFRSLGYQIDWVPSLEDAYVAIDERVGTTFGVVVSVWPSVDPRGGLRFPKGDFLAWFEDAILQEVLDNRRSSRGQMSRPLRIGDVFWVRSFDAKDPTNWADALDVTEWARDAAKIAVYSVATGPVPSEHARELGLVSKEEADSYREPPTPGPTASSAL